MGEKRIQVYRNVAKDNTDGERQLIGTIYMTFHPKNDDIQDFSGDRIGRHFIEYDFFTNSRMKLNVNDRLVDHAGNEYRITGVIVRVAIEYQQQGTMVLS